MLMLPHAEKEQNAAFVVSSYVMSTAFNLIPDLAG